MAHVPYANTIECLTYAMICTKPDIAHAVSVVSKFMANSGKVHWNVIKWILQYLKGTKDFSIKFRRSSGVEELEGFVDVDYAGDLDNRRSTTGFIFMLFGEPMRWWCSLQRTMTLFTIEAEYMAMSEASKESF